jgi:cell division control protein 12
MHDLIESTDQFYEKYRSATLSSLPNAMNARSRMKTADKMRDEESLKAKFTEQVKKEEMRFRAWEQKVPLPTFLFLAHH